MSHGCALAAGLGSTKIQGNDVSSGIAGINGENTRERERYRYRKRDREKERDRKTVLLLLTTLSKTSVSHGNRRANNSMALKVSKQKKENVQITTAN